MKQQKYRSRGMTLVELLVASTIASVVLASLFVSLGNVLLSQKKINATQSFASESRFLMERMTQLIRNNTIDYDRFFIEVGPDPTQCSAFFVDQVPKDFHNQTIEDCTCGENVCNTIPCSPGTCDNNRTCRSLFGYETLFYWNVVPGENIPRYRNLGGKKPSSTGGGEDETDYCVQAWHEESYDPEDPPELYLINKERTERIALRRAVEEIDEESVGRIQMKRELGVDTTGDGIADQWGWSSHFEEPDTCEVFIDGGDPENPLQALDAFDFMTCARAHDWTTLSPRAIDVLDFDFIPGPDREPFLNYRIAEAQLQPHVFLLLKTKLRKPADFGLDSNTEIVLTQQTAASSRVFGDIR